MSRLAFQPRPPRNHRRTPLAGEDSAATKEMAAERLLLNRPATAPSWAGKSGRRELERLARLLLIVHNRLHRQVVALAVYHRLDTPLIAERLGIGEARIRDILAAADRRLKNHEACIQRDTILARQNAGQAKHPGLPKAGPHA